MISFGGSDPTNETSKVLTGIFFGISSSILITGHAIAQDEIFGPVLSVLTFDNVDELVDRANRSKYGLAAAVWTKDIQKAHRMAHRLRSGTVWVNCYDVFDAAAPFGGFKMSGMGRELGAEGLRPYLECKTITVALGD